MVRCKHCTVCFGILKNYVTSAQCFELLIRFMVIEVVLLATFSILANSVDIFRLKFIKKYSKFSIYCSHYV